MGVPKEAVLQVIVQCVQNIRLNKRNLFKGTNICPLQQVIDLDQSTKYTKGGEPWIKTTSVLGVFTTTPAMTDRLKFILITCFKPFTFLGRFRNFQSCIINVSEPSLTLRYLHVVVPASLPIYVFFYYHLSVFVFLLLTSFSV